MQTTQKVAWKRIAVEATAIVASILIAFWIDASWQARGERLALIEYLVQFEDEVAANDELINLRLRENASDLMYLRRVFLAISDLDQKTLPESFLSDLGSALWFRAPNVSMTAFDDLATSGNLRSLTSRQLKKVINEYKQTADTLQSDFALSKSAYLDKVLPAIGPHVALSDLGWPEYENHLGPNGENTGVTPDAPFSTNIDGLKSQSVWNALFHWKTMKIDESLRLAKMKAQGFELRALLRAEVEYRSH